MRSCCLAVCIVAAACIADAADPRLRVEPAQPRAGQTIN
jgi:hypothetical protein